MPDTNQPNITPPPQGDEKRASNYIQKITTLLDKDKLTVIKTDLQRYDPSTIQDHYRIELGEYDVEVSHSKQPDSGRDFYVMLFNSVKQLATGCTDKVILAYIHLSPAQFNAFKTVAGNQLERIRKAEEEKKFKTAMHPIDEKLNSLDTGTPTNGKDSTESNQPFPAPIFDNRPAVH